MTDSPRESVVRDADADVAPSAEEGAALADLRHPEAEPLLKNLPYRLRELIPVAAAVGVGIWVLVMTGNIQAHNRGELGPQFWPTMLAIAMIVMGGLLILTNVMRGVRPADIPDHMTWWGISRLLITGAVLVGYVLLFNVLQFWLITIAVTALLVALYGLRGWRALVVFPVIIGAVLHLLFITFLGVPL